MVAILQTIGFSVARIQCSGWVLGIGSGKLSGVIETFPYPASLCAFVGASESSLAYHLCRRFAPSDIDKRAQVTFTIVAWPGAGLIISRLYLELGNSCPAEWLTRILLALTPLTIWVETFNVISSFYSPERSLPRLRILGLCHRGHNKSSYMPP